MAFFDKAVGVWRVHGHNESQKFYDTLSFKDLFFHDKHIASFCKTITGRVPEWLNESLYQNMKHYSSFLISNKRWNTLLQYMKFLIINETYFSFIFIPKFIGYIVSKGFRKITSMAAKQ
jgi:hypothetical protein